MRRIGLGAFPLAVECLNAHQVHQAPNVPATGAIATQSEQVAQHPCAGERVIGVQAIDLAHQLEVGLGDWDRNVVQGASGQLQQLRLMRQRQSVVAVNYRFALDPSIRPSARSKKSFSSASWPIFA